MAEIGAFLFSGPVSRIVGVVWAKQPDCLKPPRPFFGIVEISFRIVVSLNMGKALPFPAPRLWGRAPILRQFRRET